MYAIVAAVGWIGVVLQLSNWLHTRTGNFVYSRKLAHGLIGLLVFGVPLFFATPLVPTVLAGVGCIILAISHRWGTFHGVATKGRLSEVYFAGALTVCLASGWWIDPYLGVAAGLFLAWGDGITGLIRYPLYRTQFEKGWAGSVGMLVSCLVIALLVDPYWTGAVAAVTATLLERQPWLDDNLTVPLGSLALMGGLAVAFG